METVDQYINQFPESTQKILESIRELINEMAPEAKETIAYKMPTFELGSNKLHFAAFKKHIGFYAVYFQDSELDQKLEKYRTTKDTIQFKLNEPIPLDLVREIVKYKLDID
jgi:uncharacterized protein YdhG (YjbR/CyaY superfamily)